MAETLKDVGKHIGTWGDGHYEAIVKDDGGLMIETVFEKAPQKNTVNLSRAEWDRLVAWVEWQRQDQAK